MTNISRNKLNYGQMIQLINHMQVNLETLKAMPSHTERAAYCGLDMPFPVTVSNIAGAAKTAGIEFRAKRGPKKVRLLQSQRIGALEARVAELELSLAAYFRNAQLSA